MTEKNHATQTPKPAGVSGSDRREPAVYTAGELKEHANELFGVREEVVHGALCRDSAEHFSVEQAVQKIKQFMKAKVK